MGYNVSEKMRQPQNTTEMHEYTTDYPLEAASFFGTHLSAVVTDEPPSLQTLWQYALRFRVEELFLDSKSGAFELDESRLRSPDRP